MDFTKKINNYSNLLKNTLDALDRKEINNFLDVVLKAYSNSKSIYIFGNGGSASTASHIACDYNKGISYGFDKRFKAVSLADNIATITAYANDVSYNDIYAEQLRNFLTPGDIVIGISGSGNSKNIIKAISYANSQGNITIGMTGYNGGELKKISKYSINTNINDMELSEDMHLILCHMTKKIIIEYLNNQKYGQQSSVF